MNAGLEVLKTGPMATVQDLGRPGFASMGVGTSGAADRGSLRLANRLVGNPDDTAAVEVTLGGFQAEARQDLVVAVTGAPCSVTVERHTVAMNAAVRVPAGAVLRLGSPRSGMRSYVAMAGGIEVQPVLGSRSTDLLTGLGPPRLRPGTVLPVGTAPLAPPLNGSVPAPEPVEEELTLRVVPGPRLDRFDGSSLRTLLSSEYLVTSENNRIGIRLDGPPLPRTQEGNLPNEGIVAGTVQVPPSGKPTLSLVDHPVVGGYPAIAVVIRADIDKAAQARPGLRLRFATR